MQSVPLLGYIAAGKPIEAVSNPETLQIPESFLPGRNKHFVLRVKGESMIDAHIQDGDFVLIRPQETARNGDIVVAQVEENSVTLKQFFKEQGKIRLQPANSAYQPMYFDEVRIQGKLIGVIRRLD